MMRIDPVGIGIVPGQLFAKFLTNPAIGHHGNKSVSQRVKSLRPECALPWQFFGKCVDGRFDEEFAE